MAEPTSAALNVPLTGAEPPIEPLFDPHDFPGFTREQIIAGLTVPVLDDVLLGEGGR